MPIVKLFTFRSLKDCIKATTVLLSIPADRKAPTGTSAIICPRIDSFKRCSSSLDASSSLPLKSCACPISAVSYMDQ